MLGTGFAGANLQGAQLVGTKAALSLFDGADLQGADLSNAEMYGVTMAGTNLVNAMMINSRLDIDTSSGRLVYTTLDGSIMRGARLAGSSIAGATFAGTDLSQADFSKGETAPVIFNETRLIDGIWGTLSASLIGANLNQADFEGADLSHVDMSGADLEQTQFKFANLSQADLTGANLLFSDLRGADLSHADLSRATLLEANLAGANLSEANLDRTTFQNTTLVSKNPITLPVDLSYEEFILTLAQEDCIDGLFLVVENRELTAIPVDMANDLGKGFYDSGAWRSSAMYICAANLSGITLRGKGKNEQYAAGVDFSFADLQSADVSKIIFDDLIQIGDLRYSLRANLTGVIYNNFTIWPTGFIPPPMPDGIPNADLTDTQSDS
jgi:uncharacterized protein YjbI with pentapeptide repeats